MSVCPRMNPYVPTRPWASVALRASDFVRNQLCAWLCFCTRPVCAWPEASVPVCARVDTCWCQCLYVCSRLWQVSFCMSVCSRAGIHIWCFCVHMCVRMYPPVHFPSPGPHPPRPSCLTLISGRPASCSHQGTSGLCWVCPNSTPPPSPSTPAASASSVSLLPLCPLLLCPSSSVCSLKQAWPAFLPLHLDPPRGHREIDTQHPPPPPAHYELELPTPPSSTAGPSTLPWVLIQPSVVLTCASPASSWSLSSGCARNLGATPPFPFTSLRQTLAQEVCL